MRQAEERKWKISDAGRWLRNAFLAVLRGEFLLRLQVGRYFLHIIYTFFLMWISIWMSIKIEKTMTRVEANKEVIEELEIAHAQKTIDLVRLSKMSKVQQMLEEQGSSLTAPQEPAERIK